MWRTQPPHFTRYAYPGRAGRSTNVPGAWAICALVALIAVTLTSCAHVPGTGASSPPATTPSATQPAHGGRLAVKPCPGSPVDVLSLQPTIILTTKQEQQTTQAQVGDLIEVRLPASSHWDTLTASVGPALAAYQPQGAFDSSLNACVWDFGVVQRGDVPLQFTGGALCATDAPCPMYAILAEFTIHIR